jgi:integrase
MARQLGHSLEMFFRVYAKWIDGQNDDREMAKIQSAIRTSWPSISPPHFPDDKI